MSNNLDLIKNFIGGVELIENRMYFVMDSIFGWKQKDYTIMNYKFGDGFCVILIKFHVNLQEEEVSLPTNILYNDNVIQKYKEKLRS